MKKKNDAFELSKIGLFKVFSNMDTQSAVVAALAISFVTILATGFIDLCTYIYWNAYFSKFNIPLSYIGEAIIHENGMKYSAVLLIPLIVFVWWLLTVITNKIINLYTAFKERRENSFKNKHDKHENTAKTVLKVILSLTLIILWFVGIFSLFLWCVFQKIFILLIFGVEFFAFILKSFCRATLGKKKSFSKKAKNVIRILFVLFVVYALLAGVYFAGGLGNYENRGTQSLQITNTSNINFYELNSEDEIKTQLVLFETQDYYYVTDVTIRGGAPIGVSIMDDDTYRFIDKIDCPVKNIYGYLYYIYGNRQESYMSEMFVAYVMATFVLSIIFICLLSIPQREEEAKEEQISQAEKQNC